MIGMAIRIQNELICLIIDQNPQFGLRIRIVNFGSRKESEVAYFFVFSHIRMMGYFRLGFG